MGFWTGYFLGGSSDGCGGLALFIIVGLILLFIEEHIIPITLLYVGIQLTVRSLMWIRKKQNRDRIRFAVDHMIQVIRKGDYSGQWYRYVERVKREK